MSVYIADALAEKIINIENSNNSREGGVAGSMVIYVYDGFATDTYL